MGFNSTLGNEEGDTILSSDMDRGLENTLINRDQIIGDDGEGTGESGHSHDGTDSLDLLIHLQCGGSTPETTYDDGDGYKPACHFFYLPASGAGKKFTVTVRFLAANAAGDDTCNVQLQDESGNVEDTNTPTISGAAMAKYTSTFDITNSELVWGIVKIDADDADITWKNSVVTAQWVNS